MTVIDREKVNNREEQEGREGTSGFFGGRNDTWISEKMQRWDVSLIAGR